MAADRCPGLGADVGRAAAVLRMTWCPDFTVGPGRNRCGDSSRVCTPSNFSAYHAHRSCESLGSDSNTASLADVAAKDETYSHITGYERKSLPVRMNAV